MSIIQRALVDSAIDKYTIHEKILQYTNHSAEEKRERLIGLAHKIVNVL